MRLLILTIAILIFFSCVKEDDSDISNPTNVNVSISTYKSNFSHFEIITIKVNNYNILFDSIEAMIGNEKVVFHKLNSKNYVSVLSEKLNEGLNSIQFPFANNTIEINITKVEESNLNEEIVESTINNTFANIDSLHLKGTITNIQLEKLNNQIANYKIQYDNLNELGKRNVQGILFANSSLIKDLQHLSSGFKVKKIINGQCSNEIGNEKLGCITDQASQFLGRIKTPALLSIFSWGAGEILATSLGFGPYGLIIGGGIAAGIIAFQILPEVYKLATLVSEDLISQEWILNDFTFGLKMAIDTFQNDSPRNVELNIGSRTINSGDRGSQIVQVDSFLHFYDRFTDFWDQYGSSLTTIETPILKNDSSILHIDELTNLNLIVSGSLVSGLIEGDVENPTLKFNSNEQYNIEFDYQISYDNGDYYFITEPRNAILLPISDSNNACNGLTKISWQGYEYDIVEIKSAFFNGAIKRCWFAENLRSNIGNLVQDPELWGETSTPAWCYSTSAGANPEYGKLYNWHTVSSSQACPTGWHVATVQDFGYILGYGLNALKSQTGWTNSNGIDSVGFNAFPAGIGEILVQFVANDTIITRDMKNIGSGFSFWSTEYQDPDYVAILTYPSSLGNLRFDNIRNLPMWPDEVTVARRAHSIRCVKDY